MNVPSPWRTGLRRVTAPTAGGFRTHWSTGIAATDIRTSPKVAVVSQQLAASVVVPHPPRSEAAINDAEGVPVAWFGRWLSLAGWAMTTIAATALALAGVGLGTWFGPAIWEFLPSLVPGLPQWDWSVLAIPGLTFLALALAGAIPPAWRACRVPPGALVSGAEK
jgi:hypothetical protein